jgi:hypothetical protein
MRAIVFYLGVLKAFAEIGILEKIAHISTVSGGNIVVGLALSANGNRWPSNEQIVSTSSTHPCAAELLNRAFNGGPSGRY